MPPETVVTGFGNIPQAPAAAGPIGGPVDEYSTPIPQGATSTPGMSSAPGNPPPAPTPTTPQDEYSTPIPAGATSTPNPTQPPPQSSYHPFTDVAPDAGKIDTDAGGVAQQIGEHVAAVGAGMGKGLLDTLSGAAGLVGADKLKAQFDQGRAELDKDNASNPFLNGLGYGGESLAEFMMGDESLKELDFADRLASVAKTAKILQKSPRLLRALQVGAAAAKNAPEAIKIGAGAGLVQGVQTGIRTDGSILDRAKAGAKSGAIGGVAAGVIGKAGDWLGQKAVEAGKGLIDTNDTLSQVFNGQQAAKAAADRAQDLANDINDAKKTIDDKFTNTQDTAHSDHDTATQRATQQERSDRGFAEGTKADESAEQFDTNQGNKDAISASQRETERQATEARKAGVRSVKDALVDSKKGIGQRLLSKIRDKVGKSTLAPSELAENVNTAINEMEKGTHTTYEEGMNGEGGIVPGLGDESIPFNESALQAEAKDYNKAPDPLDHDLVKEASEMAGNNLRPDVKQLIDNIEKGSRTGEIPEDAPKPKAKKGEKAVKPIPPEIDYKNLKARDLIALRQWLRQTAANDFMRGDPNQKALVRMIKGVDDTLDQLVERSAKLAQENGGEYDDTVLSRYKNLRQGYKDARALLDSKVADKLNLKNASPDKAISDVNNYLLGGENPLAKLKVLGGIIGQGGMQNLANTWVAQVAKLAETDPKGAIKLIDSLGEEVGDKFLGPDLHGELRDAGEVYRQSLKHAQDKALGDVAEHKATEVDDKATAKATADLQTQRNSSAHRQAMREIQTRYNSAVTALSDAADNAKVAAKKTRDATIAAGKTVQASESEPFKRSLVKSLRDGDFNERLESGDFTPNDIAAVKQIIGDAKWRDITDGLINTQIEDANGDPAKFMDWWMKIRPETRAEGFLNDPVVGAKYNALVDRIQKASGYTKAAKILIGTLGSGALAGGGYAVPLHLASPLVQALAVAGGSATAATKMEWVRSLIEKAALNPKMWQRAARVGEAIGSTTQPGLTHGAASLAKTAATGMVTEGVNDVVNTVSPPPTPPPPPNPNAHHYKGTGVGVDYAGPSTIRHIYRGANGLAR